MIGRLKWDWNSGRKKWQWKSQSLSCRLALSRINICYSYCSTQEIPGLLQYSAFHFCCHLEAASQWDEMRFQETGPPFPLCQERHSPKSSRRNKVSWTEAGGKFESEDFRPAVERKMVVAADRAKNSKRKSVKIKKKCRLKDRISHVSGWKWDDRGGVEIWFHNCWCQVKKTNHKILHFGFFTCRPSWLLWIIRHSTDYHHLAAANNIKILL